MSNPLRLLLFDDSPDYRRLIERELRHAFPDIRVTKISDAQEFFQVLEKGRFDLVITDYQLHATDGLKLLQVFKERYPQCPALIFIAAGRAEEALRESEERYRLMMRATDDVIWDWNLLTDTSIRSETLQTLFGYAPEEVGSTTAHTHQWWAARIHPQEQAAVAASLKAALVKHNDAWSAEYRFRKADGSYAIVLDRSYIIRNEQGKPVRMVGSMVDITARKQAEEALQQAHAELERRVQERTAELRETNRKLEQEIAERKQIEQALKESEERYRQLAEHIREVFWINSADAQQVLYVSPAYQDIWGRPCESLYEHPTAWLDAVHPEDRPRVQQARAWKAMTGEFDQEFRIIRPDGSTRWIRSRGFPIRDPMGAIYRIVGIAEDITPRKEAEERMRQQQAELAHMARLALAGEMASGLAHELNQPLGAIATYTQTCLLLTHSGQTMGEQLIEILEKVTAQAQRAGDIIHRLRSLVRKVDPHRNAMDINALLQEMVHLTEPEARQREIRIHLELGQDLPLVFADAIQIQQVILNLMRNAIESLIESDAHPRELTLQTSRIGNEAIEVAISDTGPGLPPEAMDRLFLPFFTTKSTGMGLGLSISKSIIEAHQGRLWATYNCERGMTFHFALPCDLRRLPR